MSLLTEQIFANAAKQRASTLEGSVEGVDVAQREVSRPVGSLTSQTVCGQGYSKLRDSTAEGQ